MRSTRPETRKKGKQKPKSQSLNPKVPPTPRSALVFSESEGQSESSRRRLAQVEQRLEAQLQAPRPF